jgi:hypothetical protein
MPSFQPRHELGLIPHHPVARRGCEGPVCPLKSCLVDCIVHNFFRHPRVCNLICSDRGHLLCHPLAVTAMDAVKASIAVTATSFTSTSSSSSLTLENRRGGSRVEASHPSHWSHCSVLRACSTAWYRLPSSRPSQVSTPCVQPVTKVRSPLLG